MVTHIVLWNLKDKSQKAQQGGEMKRRLEALVGVVPGLLSAQAGPGFNGFDVGLVCTLESREALDAYQLYWGDGLIDQYLLFYENVAVEITMPLSPTPEQMALVGQKLGA